MSGIRITHIMETILILMKKNSLAFVGFFVCGMIVRFEQYKESYKANYFAKLYGIKLLPVFYEKYNPIPTRKDAEEIEYMLGKALRLRHFGVWFN